MTTKERFLAKLEDFHSYLGELQGLAGIDLEEYRRDLMRKRGIERTLQLLVETAIDLGNMLITMNRWRAPSTNREIFRILGEQGLLPEELVREMEGMVGFRNLLVHDYGRIEDAIVHGILRDRLHYFAHFAEAVASRV